jgi:hypothetical protein
MPLQAAARFTSVHLTAPIPPAAGTPGMVMLVIV